MGSITPRSSTACAFRRRLARSTTADVGALQEVGGGFGWPRGHRRAVPPDPRGDRRRVQHGRRHRAAARDRGGSRGGRAAVFVDDAHASGVLGTEWTRHRRPLRAPWPGCHPGRDPVEGRRLPRWLRRRQPGPARHPDPARPFLFSTSHPPAVVAACRSRSCRTSRRADRPACGHADQGRADPMGFNTGVSETPITP